MPGHNERKHTSPINVVVDPRPSRRHLLCLHPSSYPSCNDPASSAPPSVIPLSRHRAAHFFSTRPGPRLEPPGTDRKPNRTEEVDSSSKAIRSERKNNGRPRDPDARKLRPGPQRTPKEKLIETRVEKKRTEPNGVDSSSKGRIETGEATQKPGRPGGPGNQGCGTSGAGTKPSSMTHCRPSLPKVTVSYSFILPTPSFISCGVPASPRLSALRHHLSRRRRRLFFSTLRDLKPGTDRKTRSDRLPNRTERKPRSDQKLQRKPEPGARENKVQ